MAELNIAITGAAGVLGTALVVHLSKSTDSRVVALTTRSENEVRSRWAAEGGTEVCRSVEIIETAGIGVANGLQQAGNIDWLINCAFPRNRDGMELATGLNYQRAVFDAAAKAAVGAVFNISSQSLYRNDRLVPATETSQLDLDTPYATAKYATELIAQSALTDTPLIHGRLASLIGPKFQQRVVNKLIMRALNGHDLKISTPHVVFDYMDVRDAVEAISAVVRVRPEVGTRHLNIGSAVPMTLREVAEMVIAVANNEYGQSAALEIIDSSERRSSAMDCLKLQKEYGFRSQFNLVDSIRDIARLAHV